MATLASQKHSGNDSRPLPHQELSFQKLLMSGKVQVAETVAWIVFRRKLNARATKSSGWLGNAGLRKRENQNQKQRQVPFVLGLCASGVHHWQTTKLTKIVILMMKKSSWMGMFVNLICSGTKRWKLNAIGILKMNKFNLWFSLAATNVLKLNVSFTNEVLDCTRWTTSQQTAMETSAEKGWMLEDLMATSLTWHSVQDWIQPVNHVQVSR